MANENYPIRFEYDDQILEILGKVNRALEPFGLELEADEQEHDGFELYRIVQI